MISLITTARHEREIAAKDAEIAGLAAQLQDAWADASRIRLEKLGMMVAKGQIEKANRVLTARLAVFTGPRQRDAKGHFLPTKGRE